MKSEVTINKSKVDKTNFFLNANFFKVESIALLGLYFAIVGGVIDGALMALFPIFGLGRGLLEVQIGSLLAVKGNGVLLMQYPIGWLSDHAGFVMAGLLASGISCLAAMVIVLTTLSLNYLVLLCFLLGAATTCILTIDIIAAAYTQDHGLMAENISKVSIGFTPSSIVGAMMAGFAAENVNNDAVIWLVAITSGVLALVFFCALFKQKRLAIKIVS